MMASSLLQSILQLASLLVALASQIQAECVEDSPVIWRNNNVTCPARAVCADVFLTSREMSDGSQCLERRVFHNCLCSGGTVCPFANSAHLLHASAQQQQFTCQNVCEFPFCGNIRSVGPVSQTAEQNSPLFGGRTYMKVNCRCPRHHTPYGQVGVHRSVQASSHRFNVKTQRYSTEYVCNTTDNENLMPDPCENWQDDSRAQLLQ